MYTFENLTFMNRVDLARTSSSLEVLKSLVLCDDIMIENNVARNPMVTDDVRFEWAKDENEVVRAFAAGNSLKEETHKLLVNDSSSRVKRALVKNLRVKQEILSVLADDPDLDVVRCVAARKYISGEILDRLSYSEDLSVRIIVAGNPKIFPETLKRLANDKDYEVRSFVSLNPSATVEIFELLVDHAIEDGKDATRNRFSVSRAAVCKDLSVEYLQKIYDLGFGYYELAKNPSTPSYMLEQLTLQSFKNDIALAKHPSITELGLRNLIDVFDYNVRIEIAKNPKTPRDLIQMLLHDKNDMVRLQASKHPNCLQEDLEKYFSIETFRENLESIAREGNLSTETLLKVVNSNDYQLRDIIAGRKNLPRKVIVALKRIEKARRKRQNS